MTNYSVAHSAESVEHYTPPYIVEAARETMGGIDLDPFSCEKANRIVRALAYFTTEGFTHGWHGRVFCNPPGGKVGRESSQALAWRKLVSEVALGRAHCGVFVCFNLGFLQVSQGVGGEPPLAYPICYPKTRVDYLVDRLPQPTAKQPNRKPSKKHLADFAATGLCEGGGAPGASCVVLVPPVVDAEDMVRRFCAAFKEIGRVVVPMKEAA